MFCLDNVIEALRANIFWALAINIPIAAISFMLGAVRVSGLIIGLAYGIVIYSVGGFRAFIILFSFFLVGSVASKVRASMKKEEELGRNEKGRTAGSVVAKCSLGAFLAVLIGMAGGFHAGGIVPWLSTAYTGAFAAALADTCASELGPLHGRKAMLLTTAEVVPHGTPGGVSITGTIFGIAGAMLLGLVAVILGLVGEKAIIFVVISSLLATGMESFLRAWWPSTSFVAKQTPNFLVTLVGAAGTVLLTIVLG
jgi:uncharacterized protein (TIGR00297 family)